MSDEMPPPDPASAQDGVPLADLANGRVSRDGAWAVGLSDGEPFAVSRRCRHQLADLSRGTVDAQGCLVCPWHASKYDVRSGVMIEGPHGFLGYQGPARGYRTLVRAYASLLPLRRRLARVVSGHVVTD